MIKEAGPSYMLSHAASVDFITYRLLDPMLTEEVARNIISRR